MSDVDRRLQQPSPDTIRDIRNLLLTPNQPPRYPRGAGDDSERRLRNRKTKATFQSS